MKFADLLGSCVACGSPRIGHWATKRFEFSTKVEDTRYEIFKCAECGTGFLNPPPAAESLAEIYSKSGHGLAKPIALADVLANEAKFPNSTLDATRMAAGADRWMKSKNRRALDVGSGYGFMSQALARRGFEPTAVNPGQYENAVFAELNGFDPIPIMLDEYEDAKPFGAVLLSQVLEHIVDPKNALTKVRSLVESDGVLVCAVPNFKSINVRLLRTKDNSCLWVPEHVNYFTADGLRKLFARTGFRVVATEFESRMRPDALAARLPKLPAAPLREVVVQGQKPVRLLFNLAGLGKYITVYATTE
jgi:2-polyprenyl-3-methyl-5-hydroxy-6-metoxy-1,4-benzoquinol methylase